MQIISFSEENHDWSFIFFFGMKRRSILNRLFLAGVTNHEGQSDWQRLTSRLVTIHLGLGKKPHRKFFNILIHSSLLSCHVTIHQWVVFSSPTPMQDSIPGRQSSACQTNNNWFTDATLKMYEAEKHQPMQTWIWIFASNTYAYMYFLYST